MDNVNALLMLELLLLVDILDLAGRAGTLPMQVLLLATVIILGIVIIKLHKKREIENQRHHEENQSLQQELVKKVEAREDAMTAERKDRIGQLMKMIQEDVSAKRDIAHALENNTIAVRDLQTLIRERVPHTQHN